MRPDRNVSEIIDGINWCIKEKKRPWIILAIGLATGLIVLIATYAAILLINKDENNKPRLDDEAQSKASIFAFLVIAITISITIYLQHKYNNAYLTIAEKTNYFFKKHNYFFEINKPKRKQLIIARALLEEIRDNLLESANQDVK
ncbi:hypothetical protein [Mycoplasma sp. E35C]|uniref:hypothetical protein n=1 Tax=Mycoplasma sp. E35C TaxID=2801918 RepID=UPI001CA3DAC1|nr:hypothetical protein [Mycoplasma sp. E35C]QZX48809.1 hypothetical protein JJE79_01985 [Mycoplasma sp. E35C]